MKPLHTVGAAGAAFAVLAASLPAQQDDAALATRRDKKLKAEFLQAAPWITDYDEARAKARKTNRPIFVYFTRSYAP